MAVILGFAFVLFCFNRNRGKKSTLFQVLQPKDQDLLTSGLRGDRGSVCRGRRRPLAGARSPPRTPAAGLSPWRKKSMIDIATLGEVFVEV